MQESSYRRPLVVRILSLCLEDVARRLDRELKCALFVQRRFAAPPLGQSFAEPYENVAMFHCIDGRQSINIAHAFRRVRQPRGLATRLSISRGRVQKVNIHHSGFSRNHHRMDPPQFEITPEQRPGSLRFSRHGKEM
jgi:hypothetical protein